MLTKEYLDSLIIDAEYTTIRPVTICCLTLRSGFKVIGKSAVLDPEKFNAEIGQKVAYEDAFNQLWELEGYHQKAMTGNNAIYRLVMEHAQLKERVEKLDTALAANKVPDDHKELLVQQLDAMKQYLAILDQRMKITHY